MDTPISGSKTTPTSSSSRKKRRRKGSGIKTDSTPRQLFSMTKTEESRLTEQSDTNELEFLDKVVANFSLEESSEEQPKPPPTGQGFAPKVIERTVSCDSGSLTSPVKEEQNTMTDKLYSSVSVEGVSPTTKNLRPWGIRKNRCVKRVTELNDYTVHNITYSCISDEF